MKERRRRRMGGIHCGKCVRRARHVPSPALKTSIHFSSFLFSSISVHFVASKPACHLSSHEHATKVSSPITPTPKRVPHPCRVCVTAKCLPDFWLFFLPLFSPCLNEKFGWTRGKIKTAPTSFPSGGIKLKFYCATESLKYCEYSLLFASRKWSFLKMLGGRNWYILYVCITISEKLLYCLIHKYIHKQDLHETQNSI